ESALKTQVAELEDAALRSQVAALVPAGNVDPVGAISALAQLMMLDRQMVAARQVGAGDARRLVDLSITAAGVIQQRGNALLQSGAQLSVRQSVQLLSALTDATYGAGLLGERERAASSDALRDLLATPKQPRQDFTERLQASERAVEWAQSNAVLAFAEVWAPW